MQLASMLMEAGAFPLWGIVSFALLLFLLALDDH